MNNAELQLLRGSSPILLVHNNNIKQTAEKRIEPAILPSEAMKIETP
jgi:hypothetical protein